MSMSPSLWRNYDQVDAGPDKVDDSQETTHDREATKDKEKVTAKAREAIRALKNSIIPKQKEVENPKPAKKNPEHNTAGDLERWNSLDQDRYDPTHVGQSLQRLQGIWWEISGSDALSETIEAYQTRLDKGEQIDVDEMKTAIKKEYFAIFKANASETDLSSRGRLKLQKDKINTNIDGLFIDREKENIDAFSNMVDLSQIDQETKNTLIRNGVITIEQQYRKRNAQALNAQFETVEIDTVEEHIKTWLYNQEINTSIRNSINKFDVMVIEHFLTSQEYDPQETWYSRESLIVDYLNTASHNRENNDNAENPSNRNNSGLLEGLEADQENDQAGHGRMDFLRFDEQPTSLGEAVGTVRRIWTILNEDWESRWLSRLVNIKGYLLDIQETWEIDNNEIANIIDRIVRHIDGLKDDQLVKQIEAMQNETNEEILLVFLQEQQEKLDTLWFTALYSLYDLVWFDDDQVVPTDKNKLIQLIDDWINERVWKSKLGYRWFIENGIASLKGNKLSTTMIKGEEYKLTIWSTDFLFHKNKQWKMYFFSRDMSTSSSRRKIPIKPWTTYEIWRNKTALTWKLYDNSIAKNHASLEISANWSLTLNDISNQWTILKRLKNAETPRLKWRIIEGES